MTSFGSGYGYGSPTGGSGAPGNQSDGGGAFASPTTSSTSAGDVDMFAGDHYANSFGDADNFSAAAAAAAGGGGLAGAGMAHSAFNGDADGAEERMAEWSRALSDKADRYREAGKRTEELRLSAVSPDGAVQVVVKADGSLVDLQFGDRARTIPLEHLSVVVMETVRQAQATIADEVSDVMSRTLGDEDQQTRDMVLGNLRSRFAAADGLDDFRDAHAADNAAHANDDDDRNDPW